MSPRRARPRRAGRGRVRSSPSRLQKVIPHGRGSNAIRADPAAGRPESFAAGYVVALAIVLAGRHRPRTRSRATGWRGWRASAYFPILLLPMVRRGVTVARRRRSAATIWWLVVRAADGPGRGRDVAVPTRAARRRRPARIRPRARWAAQAALKSRPRGADAARSDPRLRRRLAARSMRVKRRYTRAAAAMIRVEETSVTLASALSEGSGERRAERSR